MIPLHLKKVSNQRRIFMGWIWARPFGFTLGGWVGLHVIIKYQALVPINRKRLAVFRRPVSRY
jgi:hypothetical protein